MIENLHLHADHASVLLDGDLDWLRAHELVHAIDTAVDYYLYAHVEIQVRSLGGSLEPLKYLLGVLTRHRERGVRFRARALARTSSAAALLVALGDERVAEPGARLLFHVSHVYRNTDLSARDCSDLEAALSRSDDKVIARLVERAITGPHAAPEHGAEPSDREVVEGLCLGAAPDPGSNAPARVQTLAMALGQTVDDALRNNDRTSLARLYERLFEIDRPISGQLARTLRLIDRVSDASAGSPACERTPFASPVGELAPETLLRHVLVLGDDAGAPTSLCLAPLVTALAKAPPGQVGPVLVLNPDPELRAVLHAVSQGRLQVLDPNRIMIDLMAGERSLAPLLETGRWMTAATSILERTLDLIPGSPVRSLLDVSGRVFDPVLREGTHLAVSVLACVLMLTWQSSRRPDGWLPEHDWDQTLCCELVERAHGGEGERGPNLLALASWLLGVVPGLLPAKIAKEAIDASGSAGREAREVHRGLSDGGEALSHPSGHARAVLSVAQAIVAPFAGPVTRSSIYFGCEPGLNSAEALDVAALDPGFLVFEPKDDGSDTLVTTALKELFFEAVLVRGAGAENLPVPPRCGYIASSFERYATDTDRIFLERARSGGGFAVLTSRSVSAIEHQLHALPGGASLFSAIWSGTGTKLFLRSTDPRTQDLARALAPRRPGLPDVLEVRPLSGLGPDESYVSRVDGHLERRRLAPWTGADASSEDAASTPGEPS